MTEGYWKLLCVSHSQLALWYSGYDSWLRICQLWVRIQESSRFQWNYYINSLRGNTWGHNHLCCMGRRSRLPSFQMQFLWTLKARSHSKVKAKSFFDVWIFSFARCERALKKVRERHEHHGLLPQNLFLKYDANAKCEQSLNTQLELQPLRGRNLKQECIPVGCALPASMAVSPAHTALTLTPIMDRQTSVKTLPLQTSFAEGN